MRPLRPRLSAPSAVETHGFPAARSMSSTRPHSPRRALAVLTLLLALPGTALADSRAEVSIMDDQLLLNATSQERVDRELKTFVNLGVDRPVSYTHLRAH